jgi:hypothetical protein
MNIALRQIHGHEDQWAIVRTDHDQACTESTDIDDHRMFLMLKIFIIVY